MTLRPYQQRALDASIEWMRQSTEPFLIEAATGAGKSHIIAEAAKTIHQKTGKRVLCLAPSAELVKQNREKYLATGNPASLFSASAGGKDLRHPVVFGSPLTVKNRISRFCAQGDAGFALVVVDECHGITPTVQGIIDHMRKANPYLRVMGLTATPYRLGSGYIFKMWPDGRVNSEGQSRAPYFTACVDEIKAPELIAAGYLTPPVIGQINADGYETSGMALNSRGQFDAADVDKAYHGHGRKTSAIVADVVAQSRDRKGVMFFAATVQHAQEVLASLPPELSAIVTAETKQAERASMLRRFKDRQIKYLVNVSVLTTGFDAPHVDVIAILRKTESVGLLQQIIGRGLRLDHGKDDCLVLDYTDNIDDHCSDGDLFAPIIEAGKAPGEQGGLKAECEWCGYVNDFTPRPDASDFIDAELVDAHGYCVTTYGVRVETEFGPMAAHFGRRCVGLVRDASTGSFDRCEYRWTSKDCPHCDEPNDIAARYCIGCKAEIVDPNEKLRGDFRAKKSDPAKLQCDEVLSMEQRPGVSAKGNRTLRLDFVTPYRSFAIWLLLDADNSRARRDWQMFHHATNGGQHAPSTVSYRKEESGFYRVFGYDQQADQEPGQMESQHAAE